MQSFLQVALLLILGTIVGLEAASVNQAVKAPDGFTYLGSFKRQRAAGDYEDTDYFLSDNAASWAAARRDCMSQGEGDNLVTFETLEEVEFVKDKIILSGSSATQFWMGGLYDTRQKVWKWENGLDFASWAPWGEREPLLLNAQARPTITVFSLFDYIWQTYSQTSLFRYVCERPKTTIAIPCETSNDLMIVVDASGSIGSEFFKDALNFAAKLAKAWKENGGNKVGCVTFSDQVTSIVPLSNTLSGGQVESNILNAYYSAGMTMTHQGLNRGIDEILASGRQVPRNLVVITDGGSSEPTNTLVASKRSAEAGIRTFAIGVSNAINPEELLAIANNNSKHVLNVDSYTELLKLLTPVSLRVCATD